MQSRHCVKSPTRVESQFKQDVFWRRSKLSNDGGESEAAVCCVRCCQNFSACDGEGDALQTCTMPVCDKVEHRSVKLMDAQASKIAALTVCSRMPGVLCDAKNETFVSDMLCRDTRKESIRTINKYYNIEDTWRSQEEAEPGESPYSGQSLA
jgi:hypothetical protein